VAEELSIIVRVKNLTKRGFNRIAQGVNAFRRRFSSGVTGALLSLKGLAAGFIGFTAIAATFVKAIATSFEFEKYQTQFAVLFGNMDTAKQHFDDLKEFANVTPFQLTDIAAASKVMLAMTGGVLGLKDSLMLVGDAAAAVGAPIQEVGMWTARAYGAIRNGQPFGEAAARLQEMGILSGSARQKMEELQKAGASNAEVWGLLQAELEKSEGGMEKLSLTGDGLISTLKDKWTGALAAFGDKFKDLAKDKIQGLIDMIDRLRQDGTIDKWADHALEAMEALAKGIKFVIEQLDFAAKVVKRMNDGESLEEAAAGVIARKFISDALKGGKDRIAEKAAEEESRLAEEAAKKKLEIEKKAELEKKAAAKRIADDLALGQKQADEKAAKEAEKKADKAAKKAAEKAVKDLKVLRKKVRDFERGAEVRDNQVAKKKAEERLGREQAALERAAARRRETPQDRKDRRQAEREKALARGFTQEELRDFRLRKANRNDLTKGEELALDEDRKNNEKVDKLIERQKEGQKLTPHERRLIDERKAVVAVEKERKKIEQAKLNLEKLRLQREADQAKDIKGIRQKIEGLLVLKGGG